MEPSMEWNLMQIRPRPHPQPTFAHKTMETLKNYIGGEFVECDRHLDSYNPATGEVHLRIPDSGKEEVQAAVDAAKKAFKKSGPNRSGCG